MLRKRSINWTKFTDYLLNYEGDVIQEQYNTYSIRYRHIYIYFLHSTMPSTTIVYIKDYDTKVGKVEMNITEFLSASSNRIYKRILKQYDKMIDKQQREQQLINKKRAEELLFGVSDE